MVTAPTFPEALSLPVAGLREASIHIKFGAGELHLGKAEAGVLLSGHFDHGVVPKIVSPGVIELEPPDPHLVLTSGSTLHWDVRLTSEIPVDLRLDTGANQSKIDLTQLTVRRIELHTGASDTTLKLPAAGQTGVRIECGFAQVTVEVPFGVAARIRGTMGLGSIDVDDRRFSRVDGGWLSPGFEDAPDRIDMVVKGGFGSVRIR